MSTKIFPTAQDAENAFYEALERGDLEGMEAVIQRPGGFVGAEKPTKRPFKMLSTGKLWMTANGAQKKPRERPLSVRTISSSQFRPITIGPVIPSGGGVTWPSIHTMSTYLDAAGLAINSRYCNAWDGTHICSVSSLPRWNTCLEATKGF